MMRRNPLTLVSWAIATIVMSACRDEFKPRDVPSAVDSRRCEWAVQGGDPTFATIGGPSFAVQTTLNNTTCPYLAARLLDTVRFRLYMLRDSIAFTQWPPPLPLEMSVRNGDSVLSLRNAANTIQPNQRLLSFWVRAVPNPPAVPANSWRNEPIGFYLTPGGPGQSNVMNEVADLRWSFAANSPPTASAWLRVALPGRIDTMPARIRAPASIRLGRGATFVAVTGVDTSFYFFEWSVDGQVVPGANGATYTHAFEDQANHSVSVTEIYGTGVRKTATTEVTASYQAIVSGTASLAVGGTGWWTVNDPGGTPPLSHSWAIDGVEVSSADFASATFFDAGWHSISVRVTDGLGRVTVAGLSIYVDAGGGGDPPMRVARPSRMPQRSP